MTASLEFRKNVDDIYKGDIPKKYTRLVPYIHGNTILEVGAAEGVLSLLLARTKGRVIGIERSEERYLSALELQKTWKGLGYQVDNCQFYNIDIANSLDLLDGIDTFVAIRTMYYFGDTLDTIFTNVSQQCRFIILGGNKNRARQYTKGNYLGNIGKNNRYASLGGMETVARKYGYNIEFSISETTGIDPILVGKKSLQKASTLPEYRLRDSLLPYLKKFGLANVSKDIHIKGYTKIVLSIDDVLKKSRNVIDECHIELMYQYKLNGRSFDYRDTKYWNRLKLNNVDETRMIEKTEGFFDLYDVIKKNGFQMHKKNPVIVADLKGIMSDEFVEKKWRFHRCNGTHRLSIAKVLGIQEVPVLQLLISII
jgi:hypothetical protein